MSEHSGTKIPGSIMFPVLDHAKIPGFAMFGGRRDFGVDNMGLATPYVGRALDQYFQDFQEISKT